MSMRMLSRCLHQRAYYFIAGGASAAAITFLSSPSHSSKEQGASTRHFGSSNNFWWRSNLTKCEAVNNRVTQDDASSCFSSTPSTVTNDDDEKEKSNANGRIDYYYKKMNPNDVDRTSLMDSHAIFGALWGKGLIERYHVYQRVTTSTEQQQTDSTPSLRELAVVDLKVGKKLNGHRGITHGGVISLLFDEAMGWAYECLQQQDRIDSTGMIIVTANLTVNFRAPLLAGSEAVIRVYHNETKGRKIYFSARLESQDGSVLFAEASSLFVLAMADKLRTKE